MIETLLDREQSLNKEHMTSQLLMTNNTYYQQQQFRHTLSDIEFKFSYKKCRHVFFNLRCKLNNMPKQETNFNCKTHQAE